MICPKCESENVVYFEKRTMRYKHIILAEAKETILTDEIPLDEEMVGFGNAETGFLCQSCNHEFYHPDAEVEPCVMDRLECPICGSQNPKHFLFVETVERHCPVLGVGEDMVELDCLNDGSPSNLDGDQSYFQCQSERCLKLPYFVRFQLSGKIQLVCG